MAVVHQYPAPIQGVSTLAPRNRARGMATEQVNWKSDVASKLMRRAGTDWEGRLVETEAENVKSILYRRGGDYIRTIIEPDGTVHGFVNNVPKPVNGNLTGYLTDINKVQMTGLRDTVFVVDSGVEVKMLPDVDERSRVVIINVVQALEYSEVVTINVTRKTIDGSFPDAEYQTSITIPDLNPSSPGAADKARATAKVAENIAAALNNDNLIPPVAAVEAIHMGSSVAVYSTGDAITGDQIYELFISIENGSGGGALKVLNDEIDNMEGMPTFAVHGKRVEVGKDFATQTGGTRGVFYLEAQSLKDPDKAPETDPTLMELEECKWIETRGFDLEYKLDATTMPQTVIYDEVAEEFIVGPPQVGWDDRMVGDDESNRVPGFVGETINAVSAVQNRLVLLAGDGLYGSETDNLYNFWKQSALQLLVTDPIGVKSTIPGVDELKQVAQHNRDTLVIADNAQFKLDGTQALTPQTVSLPMTTAYNCLTDVSPVSVGNTVYLPIPYSNSSGLTAYSGEPNTTQDIATHISTHIVGYMPGNIIDLTSSSNLEMVLMRTDGMAENEFAVFEHGRHTNGQLMQSAWHKWALSEGKILKTDLIDQRIELLVKLDNGLHVVKVQLHDGTTVGKEKVFLDYMIRLETDGATCELPADYNSDDIMVVQEDGCYYPMFRADFTITGSTITFNEQIADGQATVCVGKKYQSKYVPTRPFVYNQDGAVDSWDRVRVNRWVLNLVDSHYLAMEIESKYGEVFSKQEWKSAQIGTTSAVLGEKTFSNQDVQFSFGQNADDALPVFTTDSWLNTVIAGIGWTGQYYRERQRI